MPRPVKPIDWKGFYQVLSDGRIRITATALMALGLSHPNRILDVYLWGRPCKVFLLDRPWKLGPKVADSDVDEYSLRAVRLNELPGWPPKLASTSHVNEMPDLLECELVKVSYVSSGSPDQGGLLYALQHHGKRFQAWHVECPYPLLMSVEATLSRDGVPGRKMVDLQDLKLEGALD